MSFPIPQFPNSTSLPEAEKHGYELIPGTKAFGSFFRLGFSHHFFEFIPVEISRIWPKMLLHLFIGGDHLSGFLVISHLTIYPIGTPLSMRKSYFGQMCAL